MGDASFAFAEPFDTDNGELDGLTPQQVFTLGVEWEMARRQMGEVRAFSRLIHWSNAGRILRMGARRGRRVDLRRLDGTWAEIDVAMMDVSRG